MLILSTFVLLSFSSPTFSLVSNVWRYVSHKNVGSDRPAFPISQIPTINNLEAYLTKIESSFLSRASYTDENNQEAIEYLKENLRWKNFTFIYCGQTVEQYTDKFVYYEFLKFESVQYTEVVGKPHYKFIKEPINMLNILMTFKLRSSMSFIMTQKIMINAKEISGFLKDVTWRIQRLEITGACVNTEMLNKRFVTNTWEPKSKPTKVTAQQFMNTVIDWIPFSDKFDEMKFHKNVHIATIGGRTWLTHDGFRSYMLAYTKRYIIRKGLKEDYGNHAETQIITEDADHIVFQTSAFFERRWYPQNKELWQFQIEAAYNTSSNEQWEIMNIFFRPTMKKIRQNPRDMEAADDFVYDVMREIQEIGTTSDHSNYNRFGLIKRFKDTKLVENERLRPMDGYGNNTHRLMIFLAPSMKTKFNRCEKSTTFENNGSFKDSVITCNYTNTHTKQTITKLTHLKIFGANNDVSGDIDVDRIEILDHTFDVPKTHEGESEVKRNYIKKISSIMICQSSMEYYNWEICAQKLLRYVDNDEFTFTLCGKTKKGSEFFIKYLERRRRKFKLMEIEPMIIIKKWRFGMVFRLRYFFINYMNYVVKEGYEFYINVNDYSKVRHVEINDSCVNSNQFRRNLITSIESTRFSESGNVSAKQFMEIIGNSLPYIENDGKIDANNYSPKFEAIIETNLKNSYVYTLKNFTYYMQFFTLNYKLRDAYFEKNENTKSNMTIIAEEPDHFVIKITMIFDFFFDNKNQTSYDEWTFIIEASYGDGQWRIDKLVMTALNSLLEIDRIQRRVAVLHMMSVDENFREIVSIVDRIPYDPKFDMENCQTREYNYTAKDTGVFFKQFLGFFKKDNVTGPIVVRRLSEEFNIASFTFKMSYFYTINGLGKHIDVLHVVNFNSKYNFYYDTKITLFCPMIMDDHEKKRMFPLDQLKI